MVLGTGKMYGCLVLCLKFYLKKHQLTTCVFLLLVSVKKTRRTAHVKERSQHSEENSGVRRRPPITQQMFRDASLISSRKREADLEYCNECGVTLPLHASENVLRSGNQTTSIAPAMTIVPCFSCRKKSAKNAANVERKHLPNDGSPSKITEIESWSSHAVRMEKKGVNKVECQPQAMSHERTVSEYVWHVASIVASKICNVDFIWSSAGLLARAPLDLMRSKKRKVEGEDADVPYGCSDITVTAERQVPGNPSAKFTVTNDPEGSEIRSGNVVVEGGPRRVIGISNLGNTCYFNSVLQCLGALEPMREHFLSTTVTRKGTPLMSALQEFYIASSVTQKILPDENPSAEKINRDTCRGTEGNKLRNVQKRDKVRRKHDPIFFLKAVRDKYPQFKGGNQEDSLDLLNCLLDGLHVEEISSQHLGQGEVGVDQIVGFLEANSSECQKCSHKTTSIQRSQSISLPVWMLTSIQRESNEGNVGRRLRGGGGGDVIDIENVSYSQYPAEWAIQFLLDGIEQEGAVDAKDKLESDTTRVTEPNHLLHNIFKNERCHEKGDTEEGVEKGDYEGDRRDNVLLSAGSNAVNQNHDISQYVGVETCEVGEVLGEETEKMKNMEKDMIGKSTEVEVSGLDDILWSPTPTVAVTQMDLNFMSSEGCDVTITRQLSDDVPYMRLGSHVAREDDEEGRTGMSNIDAVKSAILAGSHTVSVEGTLYNEPGMRMGSQTLESDQSAQKKFESTAKGGDRMIGNVVREEGRGRKRGWEVPLNGVLAVEENETNENPTPQVSGNEGQPMAPSNPIDFNDCADRALISGASVYVQNPKLAQPEVNGTGVLPPIMPVDGASNGKEISPRGTVGKAVPVSASIPPPTVVPRVKVTLHDCLREYTKDEEFSGVNAWYCTGCTEQDKNTAKEKRRTGKMIRTIQTEDVSREGETLGASFGGSFQEDVNVDDRWPPVRSDVTMKRTLLNTLPQVLIFHLNRFENDEFRPGHLKKTSGHVAFEEILDMQPYLDSRVVDGYYRLMGVVSHAGAIGWGHYVAYVRGGEAPIEHTPLHQEFDTQHTPWFYCSDTYVKETRLEEVLQCEAYLLFYQKL